MSNRVRVSDNKWSLSTPVVFLIFNRPETTQEAFEQIAEAEPPELYVVADGPRDEYPEDKRRCDRTRAIIDEVDWECDVHRNFADENLGLRRRIPTGLNWVFNQVTEAIILEDDCVPNHSFFKFCDAMLEEYRDDERVVNITGTNFLGEWKSDVQDYHFSTHGSVWGWATWSACWDTYDVSMELWSDPEVRERIADFISDDAQYYWRRQRYWETYKGELPTWDFQWGFARQINSGLSIVPAKNLVSNIGFGDGATNTGNSRLPQANIPRRKMSFPVDINRFVSPDRKYDKRMFEMISPKKIRVLGEIYKRTPDTIRDYIFG